MRVLEYLNWHTVKRLMVWLTRPRQAVLGLRELLHARKAGPVRSNIDLSNLPEVQLVLAKNSPDLASVILLYKRNPSRFIIAPRSREALEKMLSDNVIFYRILDSRGNHVGNLAYQSARRMFLTFHTEARAMDWQRNWRESGRLLFKVYKVCIRRSSGIIIEH
jgi:hypothetical protein